MHFRNQDFQSTLKIGLGHKLIIPNIVSIEENKPAKEAREN